MGQIISKVRLDPATGEILRDKNGDALLDRTMAAEAHGISVPKEVWDELFRRAKRASWNEELIEPLEHNGQKLIMLQKEPNAGKIKALTEAEIDPKDRQNKKVIDELAERVKFLEAQIRKQERADNNESDAKGPRVQKKLAEAALMRSPEMQEFLKKHWKVQVKDVQDGSADALLKEFSAINNLAKPVKDAVDARGEAIIKAARGG